MKRPFFLLSFGIGAMLLAVNEARATTCADHAVVVARLAEAYGESRQSMALAGDDSVIEIFASRRTGTWTMTLTRAGGPTCLIAAGTAFEWLQEPLPGTEQGA